MNRMTVVAGLAAVLVGCEMTEKMAIDKAQELIASQLKQPGSAQFRGVFSTGTPESGAICGTVNARNSFGGYTGYSRFSAYFRYSKGGSVSVSDLQVEEGRLAEKMLDGKSYFQGYYWEKRCLTSAARTNT